jgi:hypothetical protein
MLIRNIVCSAAILSTSFSFAQGYKDINNIPGKPLDTVNIQSVQAQRPTISDITLTYKVDNKISTANSKKCDFVAYVKSSAPNGLDFGIEYAYSNGRTIAGGRDYEQSFLFKGDHVAEGYRFDKATQVVKASCFELSPGQNPAQVPSPTDVCDPAQDAKGCGNTCEADAQNPSQCKDPNQPWPNDPVFVD